MSFEDPKHTDEEPNITRQEVTTTRFVFVNTAVETPPTEVTSEQNELEWDSYSVGSETSPHLARSLSVTSYHSSEEDLPEVEEECRVARLDSGEEICVMMGMKGLVVETPMQQLPSKEMIVTDLK